MAPAGVRGNVRDREPEMASIIGWQVGDATDFQQQQQQQRGRRRKPLLGAAVDDRWETEAHQQYRYYTIGDPTPLEQQQMASHTHQYTQHTRHLEQQQQRQIDQHNSRQRQQQQHQHQQQQQQHQPQFNDNDERADYDEVDSVASTNPPPSSSTTLTGTGSRGNGGGRGGATQQQRPGTGKAANASSKHVERMRAARKKKAMQKKKKKQVFTNREMPDSTAGRKLHQAPFHAYGRGNTHPVTKYAAVLDVGACGVDVRVLLCCALVSGLTRPLSPLLHRFCCTHARHVHTFDIIRAGNFLVATT